MTKKKEIKNLFKKLKFKENYLIIHSDLTSFYEFKFNIKDFFKSLSCSLGKNKTLIFPSFTLKKKEKWYCNKSKGESGALSEYVRKNFSNVRSIHPVHSVCIYGPNKNKIPINKCISSFGKNSPWEWLCKNKDVRNISLGIGVAGGATIWHYTEEKLKVHYRSYNTIKTKVYDSKNKLVKKNFKYFARKKGFKNSLMRCEKFLRKKNILKIHKNSYQIPILSMNAKLATDAICNQLIKNKNFLLKK